MEGSLPSRAVLVEPIDDKAGHRWRRQGLDLPRWRNQATGNRSWVGGDERTGPGPEAADSGRCLRRKRPGGRGHGAGLGVRRTVIPSSWDKAVAREQRTPAPISAAATAKMPEGVREPPRSVASDRLAPNCFGVPDRRALRKRGACRFARGPSAAALVPIRAADRDSGAPSLRYWN